MRSCSWDQHVLHVSQACITIERSVCLSGPITCDGNMHANYDKLYYQLKCHDMNTIHN